MPIFDSEELTSARVIRPGTDFSITKLYVKDVSFESPNSPRVFEIVEWKPDVDLHLHTETVRFSDTDYEVSLRASVTVTCQERTMYLTDVTVGGAFAITGLTEEELAPILGSYCPSILFPYLREAVSDLAVRGGFPQLVLSPVNFDALYQGQGKGAPAPPPTPASAT